MEAMIDPKLLKPKPTATDPTWRFWEKKNFNIHRGIIEWFVDRNFESIDELALRIRSVVKSEFNPGWLRGFGFGTVLHVKKVSKDFVRICDHIDGRNRLEGVWQWPSFNSTTTKLLSESIHGCTATSALCSTLSSKDSREMAMNARLQTRKLTNLSRRWRKFMQ